MFTKYISKNIQEKMKAKEKALARKSNSGGLSMKDMATRTAFVRMASNKSDVTLNKLIEGGLRSNIENKKQFGFSEAYNFTGFDNTGKEIKPLPGIKSIECSYKGGFKAIRECTVNWVVPHIDMLNELTPYFFTVGKTVVVDWGWVYGNQNIDKQLVDTFIYFETDESLRRKVLIDQNIFNNPQDLILKKNGDYDAIGGQVTNFEYNLREDGGFDCITKIISMGSSLFKKPIDIGGNQAGFKISGNDAKSTPPDSLINCVLNLRKIILNSSFYIRGEVLGKEKVIKNIGLNKKYGDADSRRFYRDSNGKLKKFSYLDYSKHNLSNHPVNDFNGYALNVDNIQNPNVLWALFEGRQEFFVTWGWMEDNIINRYVSFEAGDDRKPKLTMRSIDTLLDEEGLPISTEDLGDEAFGQGGLQDKYDIDLNTSELNNFVKRNTLIRNPKGLFPVNPFLFFIPETDYIGLDVKRLERTNVNVERRTRTKKEKRNREDLARENFYSDFTKIWTTSGTKIKRFAYKPNPRFGSLRNIWVNIKEIQKAFGISNPNSSDTSTSNINPPGTIDVAVNNLLTSLNTNFHNIWDFELGVDPYDSTNIKVIDKSDAEIRNPQYTKYEENSHKVKSGENEKDGAGGIFQFPTFKVGSFVKNQSLQFKIPTAQAITILYGSNKPKGDNDPEYANGQLDKLFRHDISKSEDRYLSNMKSSHQNSAGNKGEIKINVGSHNANPNSRISFSTGFGIPIYTNSTWWRQWTPDIDKNAKKKETSTNAAEYYEVVPVDTGVKIMLVRNNKEVEVERLYEKDSNGHLVLSSRIQNRLNSFLNANSPVQQFDMSNLIPAELGLEIDGTGGIIPFDLIHTEYIEEKYKSELISYSYIMSSEQVESTNRFDAGDDAAYMEEEDFNFLERTTEEQREVEEKPKAELGPLTYFQLFDVTHVVDESGWKTQLNSKMRINHIPRDDFVTFADKEEVSSEPKEFEENPSQEEIDSLIPSPIPDNLPSTDDTETATIGTLEDQSVQQNLIPVQEVNNASRPVPSNDEDIAGDEDLEDLDFDDIPPWIPPSSPSTLSLREAKTEIELQPEKVPEQAPPDVPPLDVGPIMSPDDIDKLLAKAVTDGTSVNNDTDLVEYPPEPEPTVPPSQPSAPIVSSPPEAEAPSKKEQLQTQKIIYVHPSPELTNETGQVPKAQRFETPIVEEKEIDYGNPTVATIEVNKNIRVQVRRKATLPPSLIESREVIDLKSTYRGTETQNNILYALREDWRPLYEVGNTSPKRLSGYKFKLDGNGKRIPDSSSPDGFKVRKLIRKALPLPTRQKYWDVYVEAKNENGQTRVQYTDRDNFQTYPAITPTGDLVRRQRSKFWYSKEFNPKYER